MRAREKFRRQGISPVFEQLEKRLLLSADAPTIDLVEADNRGLVVLTVSRDLISNTVNQQSVRVTTAGDDLILGTADDVLVDRDVTYNGVERTITIEADVAADERYRVFLDSSVIRGANGCFLDGEFNGAGAPSGDGVEGGDFEIFTRQAEAQIVRFHTVSGIIDVRLFSTQTPQTIANFLNYANRADWDGTFIQRSVGGDALDPATFVIQGGGFSGEPGFPPIPTDPPVMNEPVRSNVRGTIAMAKMAGNPNSATNQWFFNLGDNSANLDNQNGGFTAFGEITDQAGLDVMDALAAFQRTNASATNPAFSDLPVIDLDAVNARGGEVLPSDLVLISRISLLVEVSDEAAEQLDPTGSLVFEDDRSDAVVRLFDLDNAGILGGRDAVRVNFGSNGAVNSIQISSDFPDARIGLHVSNARRIGSIVDQRDAGDLGFVVTDASVGSLDLRSSITGYDLNGFLLPNQILPEDIDGDGDLDDLVAFFTPVGETDSLRIRGDLVGDVVVDGIFSTRVDGETDDVDFRFVTERSVSFQMGSVSETSVTTEGRIISIRASEWTETFGFRQAIRADSIGSITISGGADARSDGDFEPDLFLTGEGLLEGALVVGNVNIRGSLIGAEWIAPGDVGSLKVRGEIKRFELQADGTAVNIKAQAIEGADLSFGGFVRSVKAGAFEGGSLSAERIGSINISGKNASGDFEADLTVTGQNDESVRSIKVNGDWVESDVSLDGEVRSIKVKGDVRDNSFAHSGLGVRNWSAGGEFIDTDIQMASGSIRNFKADRWEDGNLRVFSMDRARLNGTDDLGGDLIGTWTINEIGTLSLRNGGSVIDSRIDFLFADLIDIEGNVEDSTIESFQQTAGPSGAPFRILRVDGSIMDSTIASAGNMGVLRAAQLVDSRVLVAFDASTEDFPSDGSLRTGAATLFNLFLTGRDVEFGMVRSFVAATTVENVRVNNPDRFNGGDAFGVSADEIGFTEIGIDGRTVSFGAGLDETISFEDFEVRVGFAPAGGDPA